MTKDELAAIKARSDADYAKGVWADWTQAEKDRAMLLAHIGAAAEPSAEPGVPFDELRLGFDQQGRFLLTFVKDGTDLVWHEVTLHKSQITSFSGLKGEVPFKVVR